MSRRGSGALLPAPPSTEEPGPDLMLHLDNFEGPFDLLLRLIGKHELDITEVALAAVTDEFIASVRAGAGWDLERTSSFLVVAATLLDLKAARLLPRGEVEDGEDLALLEARDLLFARLLQYRAFQQVATVLEERLHEEARRLPAAVPLEERYAALLPEVLLGVGLDEFAALAAAAMTPRPVVEVSTTHLHAPTVSVRDQARVVLDRVRRDGVVTFRALCDDAADTMTRVARFLCLLQLFGEEVLVFEQASPLGELLLRWTGREGEVSLSDEFEPAPVDPALVGAAP